MTSGKREPKTDQEGTEQKITRRTRLKLAAASLAATLPYSECNAAPRKTYFTWLQLKYAGSWDPNPRSARRFLETLRLRTSLEPAGARKIIEIGDPTLFEYPFLYVAGRSTFPELGPEGRDWMRRYVEHGGFVLFDDATGIPDSRFAQGVTDALSQVFPNRNLGPLPAGHAVFQSFYLLRDVPGRRIVRSFLYGMDLEDLTPVMFCANDLGGAWDGDPLGGYTHECIPGGDRQREMSFRMGINLVLYATTGNYKKDQVHIPFILKRRRR